MQIWCNLRESTKLLHIKAHRSLKKLHIRYVNTSLDQNFGEKQKGKVKRKGVKATFFVFGASFATPTVLASFQQKKFSNLQRQTAIVQFDRKNAEKTFFNFLLESCIFSFENSRISTFVWQTYFDVIIAFVVVHAAAAVSKYELHTSSHFIFQLRGYMSNFLNILFIALIKI